MESKMSRHDEEHRVIDKLSDVADKGGGEVSFSHDEAIVLRKVIKFVRGIEALGFLGTVTKNALLILGGLLIAWTQLGDWISQHVLGKGN
jgi:hypothetical protein